MTSSLAFLIFLLNILVTKYVGIFYHSYETNLNPNSFCFRKKKCELTFAVDDKLFELVCNIISFLYFNLCQM